jgi:hypothetical protein
MNTPAMRLKSTWFRPGAEKTPAEQASAMAFIVFRVGLQMLKRMRGADRMAAASLAPEARVEFTVALVKHVARTLQGNEDDLLGAPPPEAPSHADTFIDLVNEVSQHYAEFGADPTAPDDGNFHPDFAFVRYLGHRLEPTLPDKDRRWVLDQVMAIEAPQAIAQVHKALHNLYDPTPRRARGSSTTGE